MSGKIVFQRSCLACLILLLAGCATGMSEDECLSANWKAIGFQDGIEGRPVTKFAQRTEQCGEFGILPNQNQYLEGRNQGLGTYCMPEFGLNLGKAGKRYENVCPPELEPAFLAAYSLGREYYAVNKVYQDTVDAYNYNVDTVRRKIAQFNKKVDAFNKSNDAEEKERLGKELESLQKEIERLKRYQTDLQFDIDRAERELRNFMYTYPQRERALLEDLAVRR